MTTITTDFVSKMDRVSRLNLINSVTGFKPANLIGTKSTSGQSNCAIISSVIHLGSDPGLIGFVMRPLTVPRHTMRNILETSSYTINHINADIAERAHWTSADFDGHESEFDMCNLEEIYRDDFFAPFVGQSNIALGMTLVETIDIKVNGTVLVIGKIEMVHMKEDYRTSTGCLDLVKAGTIAISGLDTYHTTDILASFPYARVNDLPVF